MEILLVSAIKAVISIEGKHDYLFAGMAASFQLLLTASRRMSFLIDDL